MSRRRFRCFVKTKSSNQRSWAFRIFGKETGRRKSRIIKIIFRFWQKSTYIFCGIWRSLIYLELFPCRWYRTNQRSAFSKWRKRFLFNLFKKIKTSILFWCKSTWTIICRRQISHMQWDWFWKRFNCFRPEFQNFRSRSFYLKLFLRKIPQALPIRRNWKTCSKASCCCLSSTSQRFRKRNRFTWICLWPRAKKA